MNREGKAGGNESAPGQGPAAGAALGNTRTIARNSLWYGLEIAFSVLLVFLTSIPIARVVGPEKLGYYNYVQWLTQVSAFIGSFGIPAATRKYMSEYLGRGQGDIARAIFSTTLRMQFVFALVATTVGLVLVFTVSEPAYRHISTFLVISMLPGMVMAIPSMANVAGEDLRRNVPAGLVGGAIFVIIVALSLTLGWDLFGVAVGTFVWKSTEFVLKMISSHRWINRLPVAELPPPLRKRMFSFSRRSVVLLLLNLVVWDRSDLIFLKWLGNDIRQVAFYSLAFNITEKILMIPKVFAGATGVTLMVQYGRDKKRLRGMIATTARYLALVSLPLLLGMAALSGSVIELFYGALFLPTIPVLLLAAVFAIPKSFLQPAQELLLATENQNFLIRWGLLCAAFNIVLDLALIPPFAAIGAALANGTAQAVAVLGIWLKARRVMDLELPSASLGKVALSGLVMAAVARVVAGLLAPWAAVLAGVAIGAVVFFLMVRLTKSLGAEDRQRFRQLRQSVPARIQGGFDRLLDALIPPGRTGSLQAAEQFPGEGTA